MTGRRHWEREAAELTEELRHRGHVDEEKDEQVAALLRRGEPVAALELILGKRRRWE